jgi:hypothetical protein
VGISGSLRLQGKRVRIGAAGGPIGEVDGSNCPGGGTGGKEGG